MASRVAVLPGVEPRLIVPGAAAGERETLADYRQRGGYEEPTGAALIDLVDASGLRGRGGASFPAGRKLRAVRDSGGRRPVVVANGEEGEPASVKDRWLLRSRPHLVLDGVRHVAAAVGADLAYVYVSDADAEHSVRAAIDELQDRPVELRVIRVEPTYVAGEETAAVNAIDGRAALPSDKPPRPFESGVDGRPTLVSNVETLANLPFLVRAGAAAYREAGTERAPGTFLLTLGGAVARPGLYEVPLGTPLATVIDVLGGGGEAPAAFLVGGYFGGLLNERGKDLGLDYDTFAAAGVGLGCGAVTVVGPRECPIRVAAEVLAYFDRSNASQCGSCFNGTAAMSAVASALVTQTATETDVEALRRWSVVLKGRGACGTLDGAAQLAASLLAEFPDGVRTHLDGGCGTCRSDGRIGDTPPFAADVPGSKSGVLT